MDPYIFIRKRYECEEFVIYSFGVEFEIGILRIDKTQMCEFKTPKCREDYFSNPAFQIIKKIDYKYFQKNLSAVIFKLKEYINHGQYPDSTCLAYW